MNGHEYTSVDKKSTESMSLQEWHFFSEGKQYGPVTRDVLVRMLGDKRIPPDTPVWKSGMPNWRPAHEVAGISFKKSSGFTPTIIAASSNRTLPLSVAVIGLVTILLGSHGFAMNLNILLQGFSEIRQSGCGAGVQRLLIICGCIRIINSIPLVVLGISLFNLRAPARLWTIGFAWFMGLLSIVQIPCVNLCPAIKALTGALHIILNTREGIVGAGIGGIVYAVIVTSILQDKKAIKAFSS